MNYSTDDENNEWHSSPISTPHPATVRFWGQAIESGVTVEDMSNFVIDGWATVAPLTFFRNVATFTPELIVNEAHGRQRLFIEPEQQLVLADHKNSQFPETIPPIALWRSRLIDYLELFEEVKAADLYVAYREGELELGDVFIGQSIIDAGYVPGAAIIYPEMNKKSRLLHVKASRAGRFLQVAHYCNEARYNHEWRVDPMRVWPGGDYNGGQKKKSDLYGFNFWLKFPAGVLLQTIPQQHLQNYLNAIAYDVGRIGDDPKSHGVRRHGRPVTLCGQCPTMVRASKSNGIDCPQCGKIANEMATAQAAVLGKTYTAQTLPPMPPMLAETAIMGRLRVNGAQSLREINRSLRRKFDHSEIENALSSLVENGDIVATKQGRVGVLKLPKLSPE